MAKNLERIKAAIPTRIRRWLSRRRLAVARNSLWTDRVTSFAALRRVEPYRPYLGWRRGKCIDRFYIEAFLEANRQWIKGRVLEIGDDTYSTRYGVGVSRLDIADIDTSNKCASLFLDLTSADSIPDCSYDAIVLTQVVQLIHDFRSALRTVRRLLAPGGAILVTVPGIAPLCHPSMLGAGLEYWRFTSHSARLEFSEIFGREAVNTTTYGNVLSCTGFMHGLVVDELTTEELNHRDPSYELIIGVLARKI